MTRTLGQRLAEEAVEEVPEEEVAEMDAADEAMEEETAVGGEALTVVKTDDGKLDACPFPTASTHARNTKRWTSPRGGNSSRRVISAPFVSRCLPVRRTRTNV